MSDLWSFRIRRSFAFDVGTSINFFPLQILLLISFLKYSSQPPNYITSSIFNVGESNFIIRLVLFSFNSAPLQEAHVRFRRANQGENLLIKERRRKNPHVIYFIQAFITSKYSVFVFKILLLGNLYTQRGA